MRVLFITLCFSLVSCGVLAQQRGPIVQLKSGRIEGEYKHHVDSFLGIPYARAPIGQLRWQRPLSVVPWKGIRLATSFGPGCMQKPYKGDMAPPVKAFSEDCLTVNVWRPHHFSAPLPVMVWVHGGGFVNGGSSPAIYSGAGFARSGVILVSFNYRLGRFGFFAHPSLNDNLFRGNYGFMDQIKVLRWVQDNIMSFGGDPNNVTLFGESAGGYSGNMLLTSHYSRNLFNKAIIESGNGRYNITPHLTWKPASDTGVDFAREYGITGNGKQALTKLRALSAKEILGGVNLSNFKSLDKNYAGPMIDGRIVSEPPQQAYRSGDYMHIPVLIGANSMDFGGVEGHPKTRDAVFRQYGMDPNIANQVYPKDMSVNVLNDRIAMQKLMIEPARFVAKALSAHHTPVWEYRFGYIATEKQRKWSGAIHASEIPYVFNTLNAAYPKVVTTSDQKMAKLMHQYWVNFAKTGNPNGAGLPEWPQYRRQQDRLFWFSPKGVANSRAIVDPQKVQLDLVAKTQH
ncbi:MAG: Para-nitrobenzyl esterase [Candidatus Celerinatantimonas neptuna]|nr:MAG: Para-nitrobenzyl esterase [Candidatus Celerinatantimonas neptuna]